MRTFIQILALFLAAGSTKAGIVASFQADYVTGTTAGQTRAAASGDGWNYMTNSGGAIGTASNYTSLVWNPTANLDGKTGGYTFSSTAYPLIPPDTYVGLFADGVGHVGKGSSQDASSISRYAIAAYTIQTGEAGSLALNNGVLSTTAGIGNPLNLKVYVNDLLIHTYTGVSSSASLNFSDSLGTLNAGDTVYVAVGPGTSDNSAHFNLNFDVVTAVPEPGTLVLFTVGTITCALGALRKKRRKTA